MRVCQTFLLHWAGDGGDGRMLSPPTLHGWRRLCTEAHAYFMSASWDEKNCSLRHHWSLCLHPVTAIIWDAESDTFPITIIFDVTISLIDLEPTRTFFPQLHQSSNDSLKSQTIHWINCFDVPSCLYLQRFKTRFHFPLSSRCSLVRKFVDCHRNL